MSYRELTMIDVREVLRRWAAGQSTRKIARETSVAQSRPSARARPAVSETVLLLTRTLAAVSRLLLPSKSL